VSFAGIAPKNHPKQVRTRQSALFHESGALDSVDDRRTPLDFFEPLHERFRFTIDVAASADNALLPMYWTRQDDALRKSWGCMRVWCNPPYSAIPDWVAKAHHETLQPFPCEVAVLLLPADRTEQPFWHEYIEPFRDRPGTGVRTEFIRKRIKFGLPPEHPDANKGLANGKGGKYRYPPFGCVLVIFEARRIGGIEK
jgi:site-specific DNA-methyltransferase (adenine-specific)